MERPPSISHGSAPRTLASKNIAPRQEMGGFSCNKNVVVTPNYPIELTGSTQKHDWELYIYKDPLRDSNKTNRKKGTLNKERQ